MKRSENTVVNGSGNQEVQRRQQTLLRSLSWEIASITALSLTALVSLLTPQEANATNHSSSALPAVTSGATHSGVAAGQIEKPFATHILVSQQVLSSTEAGSLAEKPGEQPMPSSVQSLSTLVAEPNQVAPTGAAALEGELVRSTSQPESVAAPSIANLEIADSAVFAQTAPPPASSPATIEELQNQLQTVRESAEFGNVSEGSPALSIANPVGYGADNLTGFIGVSYQARTRFSEESDGALGLGIGLGDARRSVGVELAYTFASFGASRDFGTGGFDLKVHHQFAEDLAVAAGWNGFITIGEELNRDFQDSIYGVATKIFRVRENLDTPFSRAAVSIGLGSGQFRSEEDFRDDRSTVNVFGSLAVRVVQPVSAIIEWTGQDLALGLSIVPFRTSNFVITPAIRDIVGAGDGARFVLGTGFSFRF